MAKRIGIVVVVVLLGLAGYYVYARYAAANRLRNGDVTSDDVRDSDGNLAHATPSRSDTPGSSSTSSTRAQANTQSASMAELQGQTSAPSPAPATDSQTPNAPNGVAFAGTGRFQVYRQGNLTWRINTDNGTTCILFATEEEWRKPVVYNHGCGNA